MANTASSLCSCWRSWARMRVRDVAGEHDDRALEAALAQELAGLPAIHVRQADVEHDEVEVLALGELDPLRRSARSEDLEFVVQRQLVLQRFTKVLVVVDDENLACSAHETRLRLIGCLRGFQSSIRSRGETEFVSKG
jgi:hypothetical protein